MDVLLKGKNMIKVIVGFTAGFAVGGLVTYAIMEKKFNEKI